ncbi:hypothetical protein AB0K16_50445 [Nonomuraea jabiensis]|uniref:hypothetical protein n=1 Tax=Nonomuraea jabiensis TaxID=882448 RepID=UPI00343E3265
MSKSRDARYRQVIDHIETALDTTANAMTYPAVRPNDTEDPPLRDWTGTEQRKKIPGNWAAPANTIATSPLTRATKDEKAGKQRNGLQGSALNSFYTKYRW